MSPGSRRKPCLKVPNSATSDRVGHDILANTLGLSMLKICNFTRMFSLKMICKAIACEDFDLEVSYGYLNFSTKFVNRIQCRQGL